MAIEVLAVPTPDPRVSSAAHERASFYQRRADWQAKGAAHDRAVRARMVIAAPVLLVVVAILYMFVGR
jgi:hypothetical protein